MSAFFPALPVVLFVSHLNLKYNPALTWCISVTQNKVSGFS